MRKIFLFLLFLPIIGLAQKETKQSPIVTTKISDGVHRIFINNAVTVVALTGEDGTLLIDAGYEQTAKDLLKQVESISSNPVKYIINTHIHGDHTGGNLVLGKDVDIIAHENVKKYLNTPRKQGEKEIPAFPNFAQPNITFTDRMRMDFNGQNLQLIHLSGGHTNSDIVVFIPESKILVVGDLLFANYFPYIDTGNGGNPFKYLENINWLVENFPDESIVIGGHGPIYTTDEYKTYRNTLQTTINLVKENKEEGMSLEEMKEQRILKEWESFGSFFITEDRWLDTIYPFL
ncbi:MAG: MBL fold metallo-hydrolase [Bacteroidales bacterium]